ncbi:hypothetical protein FDB81_13465 [Clostridium sporogenes]|uniref:hypothetical protein n=1 Tax=Clostridium TaxID=1485 RepID=UPI0007DE85F5|nr:MULTISPECIES: hypothetical protein [Clostridium]KEI87560.1 hypothetical protein N492_11385 [Clostridium botulinum B2 267]NFL76722.1 hypothetical protein [Clostridium sporogenes]
MKKYITELLILIGISACVVGLWQGLELYIDGLIIVRRVDNIMGIILTLSLYKHFKNWIEG